MSLVSDAAIGNEGHPASRQATALVASEVMFDFLRRRRARVNAEWSTAMGWRVVTYREGQESLSMPIVPMVSGADLVCVPDIESWQRLASPAYRDRRDCVLARLEAVRWNRELTWNSLATGFVAEEAAPGTLESTQGGVVLEKLNLFAPGSQIPFEEARELWITATRNFISFATGKVTFPANKIEMVPNSVCEVVVLPALLANPNVTVLSPWEGAAKVACARIGLYFLSAYGGMQGNLRALDAVSAMGAVAGVFAQIQARAMLIAGTLPSDRGCLVDFMTKDGRKFCYGDAINACVLEGMPNRPSLWNIIAVANDPASSDKVDFDEIAAHTASVIGGPEFGIPRLRAPYKLREMPIDAVHAHAKILRKMLREIGLLDEQLVLAFGAAGQGLISIAAGETKTGVADKVPREIAVRLFIESAFQMSKLDQDPLGL